MTNLSKLLLVTVEGKSKKECEQFFNQLKSFCNISVEEIGNLSNASLVNVEISYNDNLSANHSILIREGGNEKGN